MDTSNFNKLFEAETIKDFAKPIKAVNLSKLTESEKLQFSGATKKHRHELFTKWADNIPDELRTRIMNAINNFPEGTATRTIRRKIKSQFGIKVI